MTGTKSKFPSKFQFWLYSVPATGRNFSVILNLGGNVMIDVFCLDAVILLCCSLMPHRESMKSILTHLCYVLETTSILLSSI
jgi:hypothetical protein